jgi:hypothetical protein
MSLEHTHEGEAAARALALMVSANGRIDPAELSMLDRLDAYRRMGVSRERFAALAQECLEDHTVACRARGDGSRSRGTWTRCSWA